MNGLITLSVLSVAVLLAGVFKWRYLLMPLTIAGLSIIFVLNLLDWNSLTRYYNDMIFVDNFAVAFTVLMILLSLLLFFMSDVHLKDDEEHAGEFYAILMFTLLGGQIMVSYSNLVMLFIGIEILSISLYVMAGSKKHILSSNEASLKYFLMGSFASGFLLMGIALIYGAVGSFSLSEISEYINTNGTNVSQIFIFGILMLMVGLAFKLSVAPFHFWSPDVYEGSPTLITAFMSTIVKTAALGSFLRLFYLCYGEASNQWVFLLSVLAILTMTIGNITALYQQNFKRLLAYSGISHAGYLLIAIIILGPSAFNAAFYYLAGYGLATLAAFSVLMLIEKEKKDTSIIQFNGLVKRNPWLALIMTVSLLSLAGIPPLAGFFGKYYLFSLAISKNLWLLVSLAILNSLIGVYYYFYVMISMFVKPPSDNSSISVPAGFNIVLGVTFFLTVLLGIFPGLIIDLLK